MRYSFNCYGHENITARHKTTFEFTKDHELSLNGDCIIGVRADFSLPLLKSFIKSLGSNKKIIITVETVENKFNNKNSNNDNKTKNNKNETNGYAIEKINCEINPDFNSKKEMVIRKGDFISKRTFAVKADKAACEISSGIADFLTGKNSRIRVSLDVH